MEIVSGVVIISNAVETIPGKDSCLENIVKTDVKSCSMENKSCKEAIDMICKLDSCRDIDAETCILEDESLGLTTSSDETLEENLVMGCRTPTESIFDPFAPGPEELVFAPKKKMIEGTEIPLRRQLNFELSNIRRLSFEDTEEEVAEREDDDYDDDDDILELVCKSFLDLILVNKALELAAADDGSLEAHSSEGFKTPTSGPLLKGIAETCPAAPGPLRQSSNLLRLSPSICRKLDFGSDSEDL